MKDLHIKLSPREAHQLAELSIYTESTYSNLIRCLINIGFQAALTQSTGIKPETPQEKYDIRVITDIFERLYPADEIQLIRDQEHRNYY